jgi:hypothetical protein
MNNDTSDDDTSDEHQPLQRLQPLADREAVQRWSIGTLRPFIPNASRDTWRFTLIPRLVQVGALRKVGMRWHGRQTDIEAALFPRPPSTP